jgi:integrase
MIEDIHNLDKQLKTKIEKIKSDKDLSPRNKEIILKYIRDSQLGKTIRKGQKKIISSGRNLQVAGYLLMMAKQWFKKDLDKVTQKDMEKFILDLQQGRISTSASITRKRRPYSLTTQSNIKKFIRKFYKWLLTDNRYYPDLVDWLDTTTKDTQIEAVKGLKQGVEKIVNLIPDLRRKALIFVAFDSGFRQGEILSCRIKDLEKGNDGVYYLTCPVSKTKVRRVSLALSTDYLDSWLEEHPNKDDPDANLFETSRVMMYKTVKLYGKKALKTNVTVHMLRHTSATYWATRLERTTFCKRLGWSYNSPMPDRYIDFAKVHEHKVVEIVKSEMYSDIKKENQELKIQNQSTKEELDNIKKDMELIKKLLKNQNIRKVIEKELEFI